ncbi:MAG: hypothetical protein KDD94_00585, partial [Calditrichaeota bacterium]|nr:hypothetical protein [Calditrichota bacterium]
ITRRFKISKFLEDCLAEGKIKGQPIDLLQSAGYFSLIVHKLINQKELEYAFDQYLVMPNFFKDYTDARPRAEYIKKLVLEIEQYIVEVIKKNFQDLFDESDDNKEMHEITRFADTKIVTLLCKELDSRRKDNTVKNVTRAELLEFIDNFAADSRGQYEAERETHNINIADLYMQIQNYSMRVSVVLGDIRQKYNSNVEEIRTLENYIDIERIPIILGGIAVAHSEGTLDFEKIGLFSILDDIKKDPTKFSKLIMDSIDGKFGNIEVKDEMGKTRKIDHQQFNGSNEIIRSFPEEKLCNVFTNVIFIDLLSEVSDALVSSRNMAKNSMELKTALDDIFSRSKDLLDFAEREYNKIMGISEDDD